MALQLCILGSGSSGNATFVSSETTRLLIDAGLSAREITRRMREVGADPAELDGVCISHEHRDHVNGLPTLHKKHAPTVYANAGTREALCRDAKFSNLQWKTFVNGSGFYIGDFYVEPFSVPHDAYDPVGFIIKHADTTLAVVTDMGVPTTSIRERLKQCDVLVLESNYDDRLLTNSPRPWYLKQRIMGRQGHLSNAHAAALLAEVASPRLKHVFLTHLSSECNREDLALDTVRNGLSNAGHHHVDVAITYQERISEVWVQEVIPHAAPPKVKATPAPAEQAHFGF